ncbi:hypothetical protein BIZ83_gp042 [Erwinia phage vB_EamM_ChrisDB]|uniref:hypothetical protein n=1 Tax=Erwinia phage vB_EamM_ChrisDB TaxID=1883371 RepID=UPI00081C870F|nr:hypothetical protein BIZ83_gp042 [Erwinia phage vB_EamM_ChrisDB]ANZ48811.1 hypothetical protein CHRISDB_249 [Erwinia phage vB_EamM_ChrisDB]
MNNLTFSPSVGLLLNGKRIDSTFNHHWQVLVKRLGEKARIVVTNEINLNANVEKCGQMFAFHIPRTTGKALLKHGEFTSRVSSWRMLGALSKAAERPVSQGMAPTLLEDGVISILVYRSNEDNELSYMISYAHAAVRLEDALEEIEHAG